MRRISSLLTRGDRAVGDAYRALARPQLDVLAVTTTDLGSMFMVAGAAAVLAIGGRLRLAAELTAAGSLAWVAAQEAKNPFDRPRPFEAEGVERLIRRPSGTSFPSGHAAVGAATAAVLLDATTRPMLRRVWRLMAVWVPLTRMHVGVHYPTDVTVGAIVGHLIGRAVVTSFRRLLGARDADAAAPDDQNC